MEAVAAPPLPLLLLLRLLAASVLRCEPGSAGGKLVGASRGPGRRGGRAPLSLLLSDLGKLSPALRRECGGEGRERGQAPAEGEDAHMDETGREEDGRLPAPVPPPKLLLLTPLSCKKGAQEKEASPPCSLGTYLAGGDEAVFSQGWLR